MTFLCSQPVELAKTKKRPTGTRVLEWQGLCSSSATRKIKIQGRDEVCLVLAQHARGGNASSVLDHNLGIHAVSGGCASSQVLGKVSDSKETADEGRTRGQSCGKISTFPCRHSQGVPPTDMPHVDDSSLAAAAAAAAAAADDDDDDDDDDEDEDSDGASSSGTDTPR